MQTELKDSKYGSSPLLYACQNGRTKIVKILLEKGADIFAKCNKNGRACAIHFAAQSGKTNLIDFLLQRGFDINRQNYHKETPLHYILQYWNYPQNKRTSLYEKTKILIDRGANINTKSLDSETPLMLAIMANDISVVKLLISLGANVNHGRNETTPLHYAACFQRGQHHQIIQILINNGAEIDSQAGISLTTPLHTIIFNNGSIKSAKILLENGAKLLLKNAYGETSFHLAVRYTNTEFIKLALEFQPSLVELLNTSKDFPNEFALQLKKESALKMIIHHYHKYTFN